MKFFLNLVNYMRMFHKYLVKTRVHKKFEIRILPQKLFHPIVCGGEVCGVQRVFIIEMFTFLNIIRRKC